MSSTESSGFYTEKLAVVAGGTGFVGSHLVEELLRLGASVRVPVHTRESRIQHTRLETISADLTQLPDCLAVARDANFVFQVAGPGGSSAKDPLNTMSGIRANLVIGSQMLEAAWQQGVQRFLMLSSTTVYPPSLHPLTEDEAWSGEPHSAYLGHGWMHRYLERLCDFTSASAHMKIALVRAGAVYGRWDDFHPGRSHVVPSLVRRAVEKDNPFPVRGAGDEVWDFFHVSDLARGCLIALEKHSQCGPINLGYGRGTSIKQLVELVLQAAGHQSAEVEFQRANASGNPVRTVDTSKAKRLLGFEPIVSLEEGLADTVNWYRNYSRHTTPSIAGF